MTKLRRLLLATCLVLPAVTSAQPPAPDVARAPQAPPSPLPFLIERLDPALDAIVAPDTKLKTLVTIPNFNGEGPMWREGRLWVSDQRGGNLYSIGMDGQIKMLATLAGGPIDASQRYNQGPNGLAADKDGTVIVMRQADRDIGRYHPDGTISPFLSTYEGKRFNAPNDMVFGSDGAMWFTDPTFSAPAPVREVPFAGVYRYKDGKLMAVVTDMPLPNGIGLSPDGKTLYVDNSRPPMLRAYDVAKDGTLSNQRDFYTFDATPNPALRGVPDGLKVDSKGNVWMTGPGGILIFSPAGKMLGRMQLPAGSTNVAFGGSDYKTVFFTSGATIYMIKARVAGQVPMYARR